MVLRNPQATEIDTSDEMLKAAGWGEGYKALETSTSWLRIIDDNTSENVRLHIDGSVSYFILRFLGGETREGFCVRWFPTSGDISFVAEDIRSPNNPLMFVVRSDRSSYIVCQDTNDWWNFPEPMTPEEVRTYMEKPLDNKKKSNTLGMFASTREEVLAISSETATT